MHSESEEFLREIEGLEESLRETGPMPRIRVREAGEETRWDMPPLRGTPIPAKPPAMYRPPGSRTVRGLPRNVTHQGAWKFWLPWGVIRRVPWLLFPVLILQIVLAMPLLGSTTAFEDEALYLWAGHAEWMHWLHGTPVPAFPTYFSGAPVSYPPLGALANALGGLTGARILSLVFMLVATAFLYLTGKRLYGQLAGFYSALLFSVMAPTLHVGTLATYDSMALMLLAAAAWCATGGIGQKAPAGWLIGAAALLAWANATKYATALFDPIVIAMCVLACFPQISERTAARRWALVTGTLMMLIVIGLRAGAPDYITGISHTTTGRVNGTQSPMLVFTEAWKWTAPVLIIALIAIVLAGKRQLAAITLLAVLTGASLLAPLEQARIHTTVSLDKHADFGIWFAAIAAGYALSTAARWLRANLTWVLSIPLALSLTTVFVAFTATTATGQAAKMLTWPQSGNLTSVLQPLTSHGGRFLLEDASVEQYYLTGTHWQQWSNTFSITLPNGIVQDEHQQPGPYLTAIRNHYFNVVVLWFGDTTQLDGQIAHALARDHQYAFLENVPFSRGLVHGNYFIWELRSHPVKAGHQ